MDLFTYPHSPGAKERGGTSEAAAERMLPRSRTLRARAINVLMSTYPTGLTADEIASACNETVLAMRPRISELFRLGLIEKTEQHRPNASGVSARVWRVRR